VRLSSLSLDPRLAALLRRSSGLRAAGRLAESVAPLRRAVRLAPGNAVLQHDLGVTLLNLGQADAALACFERAIAADPALAAAHLRRGVALEALQFPGAAESYRRAIAAGLESAEVYSRLATLLHREGLRFDAAPLYRRAASLAPGVPPALLDGAQAALIDGDLDEAERLFRAALARWPEAPDVRPNLANILAARGDFTAAAAELEQALRDDPQDVGLFYDLVKNRRVTPADAALLARMRAAREIPASVPNRIKLHVALAKAHDDLADYDEAGAELRTADRLRQQNNMFDRALVARQTDRILELFSPAYMAHAQHIGMATDMPILVVGMPRSGTTLVEQILAGHPAVAGAGEVHFWEAQGRAFIEAADPARGADLRQVAQAYLQRLRQVAPGAERVVDKMPFNARWAPLVHLALPNARIIHCRRNPADTCLSIMFTAMTATPTFPNTRADLVFYYREYQRVVAHVRSVLPTSCWMDIDYEQLVAEPEPAIRAMLGFSGLAWNDSCLAPERTKSVVLTYSQWQTRQPINAASAGRRARYREMLREFEGL
jgi:tetratricopeptide (TPR) repeat protein